MNASDEEDERDWQTAGTTLVSVHEVAQDRPADLPDFGKPPVVEVAIALHYQRLSQLRQGHLGLFWAGLKNEYPSTQDHPPLAPASEPLPRASQAPTFEIQLLDAPRVNRAWFIGPDDDLLMQVQDDRIVHNWRQRAGPYPRFEALTDLFWQRLDGFREMVEREVHQEIAPRLVEVSYINWVDEPTPATVLKWGDPAELSGSTVGPLPLAQAWGARYPVSRDGAEVGTLMVDAQPGERLEGGERREGSQLTLTFVAPTGRALDKANLSGLLSLGRDSIVRTFDEITTESMHQRWERLQ